MQFALQTDMGKVRSMNQDCVFASDKSEGTLPNLFMVADGMGGHKAGEYASRLAITSVLDYVRTSGVKSIEECLKGAYDSANAAVFNSSIDEDKAGMGTTLVCATVGDDHIVFSNIGDSRAYIVKDNELIQITKDHTVVEELFRQGLISKVEMKYHPDRHKITRAIGVEDGIKPDIFTIENSAADQILLCTDGLTNMVDNDTIKAVLCEDTFVNEKATRLMELANENGGVDNISLLLIDLLR